MVNKRVIFLYILICTKPGITEITHVFLSSYNTIQSYASTDKCSNVVLPVKHNVYF